MHLESMGKIVGCYGFREGLDQQHLGGKRSWNRIGLRKMQGEFFGSIYPEETCVSNCSTIHTEGPYIEMVAFAC